MVRRFFKHLLTPPMIVLAALIMFVEEWLWDKLTALMAWIARLPVLRAIETRIAALPPYWAMLVFLLPGTLLFPVKLGALYLITKGFILLGASVIIGAKVLGTAIVARLFAICRPSLLSVAWFRRLHDWVVGVKTKLYTAIGSMPAWQAAVRWKNALKERVARLLRRARTGHFMRRWKAVLRLLRRRWNQPRGTPSTAPVRAESGLGEAPKAE